MFEKLFSYFEFSKGERRGFIFLSILIILLIILFYSLDYLNLNPTVKISQSSIDSILKIYHQRDSVINAERVEKRKQFYNKYKYKNAFDSINLIDIKLELFNPNKVSDSVFLAYGFKKFQINSIRLFIQKYGPIHSKKQFLNLYSLRDDSTLKEKIIDYIDLPNEKAIERINLNLADTTELKKVKGIGSKMAYKIVNYRSKLGGFYSSDQLFELYNVDSAYILKLIPYFEINQEEITAISLNSTSENELAKHPYITKFLAKKIVKFRSENGSYSSVSDLQKFNLVNDSIYAKIAPYLTIQY